MDNELVDVLYFFHLKIWYWLEANKECWTPEFYSYQTSGGVKISLCQFASDQH